MLNLQTPEDRSAAAGEYVLGTLAPDEREAFERALGGDAALRAEVAHWQDRFLALSARVAPAEPSAGLWRRIEARLSPGAAAARAPAAPPPWWQRLGLWQSLSGLALAGCVLLGSGLVPQLMAPPATQQQQQQFVAVLQAPQGGGNGWVVEVRVDAAGQGRLRLRPVVPPQAPPPGRTLQFWTKAPGAAGPSSLGLVRTTEGSGVIELPLERLPDLRPEQLFEITLEPEGGSPIDRPTGPILYIGRAVQLEG
ncbi:MAG: anti-sigma factor [Sphaerotilus natans subsp. sulfidivorans]|uniref:anti-sigma factor n=1 Tax=Sphaerotilus sulfidivorans TaxID=639200 RepID=UPI0023543A57|nr:anti-sigma factor [Sphaerotilus sulfidivorans]MCK6401751.1 anti-sigma factor [Sphaerotilus sulfidivorans]